MDSRTLKQIKRVKTDDSELKELQDNIQDFNRQIEFLPELDARLLEDIDLVAGEDTPIPHGLNRLPIGWKIVDKAIETDIWRSQSSTKQYLYLDCTSDATVSLIVF